MSPGLVIITTWYLDFDKPFFEKTKSQETCLLTHMTMDPCLSYIRLYHDITLCYTIYYIYIYTEREIGRYSVQNTGMFLHQTDFRLMESEGKARMLKALIKKVIILF